MVNVLIIFSGIILKVNHLPGASILLTVGFALLVLAFIPVALQNLYRSEGSAQNLPLFIVTWLTCFVVFTSMLFKIQHWQYSGILIMIALPFPYVVFLPVLLRVTSKIKNFNIYNLVFVLLLLVIISVFSALLSLNVSKTTINDSFNLSKSYIKLENILIQIRGNEPQTPVDRKIDEIIKIVNDYQDIILKSEGTTRELWIADPGNLLRPDAAAVAGKALLSSGYAPVGTQLETALNSLITLMKNTRGYNGLAESAPLIFELDNPSGVGLAWGDRIFTDKNLAWTLIWLDGLKANLLMIKASVPVI